MARSNKSDNVINEIKVKKKQNKESINLRLSSLRIWTKHPGDSEYCKGLLQKPLLHLVGKPKWNGWMCNSANSPQNYRDKKNTLKHFLWTRPHKDKTIK